ncbi:hypothetical protein WA577_007232 [Blastocystis sp. JDR]
MDSVDSPSKRPQILLGITGSVATVPELCVKLHAFADVSIIATKPALHFLSIAKQYNPEYYAQFEQLHIPILQDNDEWDHYQSVKKDPVLHVELRKKADLFAIVPLTANTLAKMVAGICDNLLTSSYRAWGSSKPIIVAPCMNTEMYNHPLTGSQLATLRSWGVEVIEPVEKVLACGDVGKGALPPVDEVVERIRVLL